MNNLSPIGLITCFIFSMMLSGATINTSPVSDHSAYISSAPAYIKNLSPDTIYFKPESRKDNPGMDPNGSYPLAPGESLYQPFDAVRTASMQRGIIYRIPTGSRIVINEAGIPQPANMFARSALLLPAYGFVNSPCDNFAKLANPRAVLLQMADLVKL